MVEAGCCAVRPVENDVAMAPIAVEESGISPAGPGLDPGPSAAAKPLGARAGGVEPDRNPAAIWGSAPSGGSGMLRSWVVGVRSATPGASVSYIGELGLVEPPRPSARNDGGTHRADWSAAAFARIKSIIVTGMKNHVRFIQDGIDVVRVKLRGERLPLPLAATPDTG